MAATRKVFISYAWLDGGPVARWLHNRFNTEPGWSAWMDTKLHADSVFSHALQVQIDSADMVVVIVSPDVNRRETPSFVQRELMYAAQDDVNKPVFAARAEKCQLPLIIAGKTYIDFFDTNQYEDAFQKLIAYIDHSASRDGFPAVRTQRDLELEYLREIAKDHSIYGKIYFDLSATARLKPTAPADEQTDSEIDDFLSEIAAAVYGGRGHAADDETHTKVETFESLHTALEQFERAALIGDPGTGKTTTLRRFAYRLADAAAQDESAPLPLFVRLGSYEGGDFGAFLQSAFGGLALESYLPKRAVLLLDGLNETAHANVALIQAWLKAHPAVRVILSCRKLDYVERKLDLQRVDVLSLDMPRVYAFMSAYKLTDDQRERLFWGLAGDKVANIWRKFQAANLTFADFWSGKELTSGHPAYGSTSGEDDSVYNAFHAALRERGSYPGLLGLVSNPYMLTMTIAVFKREGDVPRNRAQLFEGFIRQLFDERGKPAAAKRPPWIDEGVQRAALARLAHRIQAEAKPTSVETEWARSVIGESAVGHDADHLLYLLASAGILEKGDSTRFVHQLLQEYFAAFEMDEDRKRGVPASKYFPSDEWWKPTGWEETAVLLAGMAGDSTAVVRWLTPVQPSLAYRCATESGAPCADDALHALLYPPAEARRAPLAVAEGGRRWAQSGDPRPGVGLRPDELPDIDWCDPILPGTFLYGDDKREERIDHAYQIARYPVTYAQYEPFVAGDGYSNKDYWTEAGWAWKTEKSATQPRYWNDPQWHLANHPVIGVTWYEAYAYANWLTAQRHTPGLIRLPTEKEWERAARGTDGRVYPWGDEYKVGYANMDEITGSTGPNYLRRTSAVGIYPQGIAPSGALDMSGNVWEWCLTQYENLSEDPERTDVRVLRGGSWSYSGPLDLRAAFRLRLDPNLRFNYRGFRVCCLPLSTLNSEFSAL